MNPIRRRFVQNSLHALFWVSHAAASPRPLFRLAFILAAGMTAYSEALAQKIAFVSEAGPFFFSTQIHVMNADGSGRTRLTEPGGFAFEPQWSPDGTRILFTVAPSHDSARSIFVMNADGSDRVNLVDDSANITSPRWSPDGTRILFLSGPAVSGPLEDRSDLYVVNSDGTSPTRFTISAEPGQAVVSAQWSPDGTKIAYTVDSIAPDISIFYVVDVASGAVEQVATGALSLRDSQWSPDGTQIVAWAAGPSNVSVGLYAVQVGSDQAPRLLDQGSVQFPRLSPDGKKILYSKFDFLLSINVDGTGITQLASAPVAGTGISQLQWTQDGTKIVAATWQSDFVDGGGKMYIMNADGSDLITLTPDDAVDYDFDVFGDFGGNVSPQISDGGVVMASLVPAVHTIAPLSIVSVFGTGFSAGSVYYPQLDEGGKIPTVLGGSCVEINGQRSPVFAMLPNQANVQAPSALPLGPVSVSVIRNCGTAQEVRGNTVMVTVAEAAPVFFLYPPYKADGFIAARFNDGFAAVAPEGAIVDQQGISKPARPGNVINLFGTGWGQTVEALRTGEIATRATSLLDGANLTVTFGGMPLDPEDVLYWGITPGAAGVYQLAIVVPANAPPGNHRVALTLYGRSSPLGPVIPVTSP